MYDAQQRVEAGLAYLDATEEAGWDEKLPRPVCIGEEHGCALALVDASRKFEVAARKRGLSHDDQVRLGFQSRSRDGSVALHEYAALSAEWNKRINARVIARAKQRVLQRARELSFA